MDHIEQPSEPLYDQVYVPCLDSTPYDGQSFDGYPARRGWDKSLLSAGNFSQHSAEKTAAFLQSWLYFGVLFEILGDLGTTANYTQPHPGLRDGRVVTYRLDAHLTSCMEAMERGLRDGMKSDRDKLSRIERALEQLSFFCCSMTVAGDAERPGGHVWPLPTGVDFSLRVLGSYMSAGIYETLWNVLQDSFIANLTFAGGHLARSRMAAAGWCPSDTSMVLEQFSPAALYYVSSLKRDLFRDHSGCSTEACLAAQVETSTYTTKHTKVGCDCDHLGPPAEKLSAILDSSRFPLISMTRTDKGKVSIELQASRPGRKYVALSHVWSDGLGNPSRNTLPMCQLSRLRSLLDELDRLESTLTLINKGYASRLWDRQRGVSIPFWIDTLCVPVGTQYQRQRSRAISMMKETYEKAHKVLVLDAELEAVPLGDTVEMMLRVSLSGWMRRLWTLQEGVLAAHLYVKFQGGILNVYSAKRELDNFIAPSSLMARLRVTYDTIPNQAARFHVDMCSLRRNVEERHEPRLFGVYTVTTPTNEAQAKRLRTGAAVMQAFIASRYRTTSRQADEYICIASLLGWDTSGLSSVPIDKRMKFLLSKQDSLPQGILFVPGPRVQEAGWGWAVTRFGNPRIRHYVGPPINDFSLAKRNEAGLTVQYPGLVLPSNYEQKSMVNIVSALICDGKEGTTWCLELTLFEPDQSIVSNEDQNCHCILFYTPGRTVGLQVSMAAAIVSISKEQRSTLRDGTEPIPCLFRGLCQLRRVSQQHSSDDPSLDPGLNPCTGYADSSSGLAYIVKSKWTVR